MAPRGIDAGAIASEVQQNMVILWKLMRAEQRRLRELHALPDADPGDLYVARAIAKSYRLQFNLLARCYNAGLRAEVPEPAWAAI